MNDYIERQIAYGDGYRTGKHAAIDQVFELLKLKPHIVNLNGEDHYVFTERDLDFIQQQVIGGASDA